MRYKMFISFMVINFKVLKKNVNTQSWYTMLLNYIYYMYLFWNSFIIDNFIKKNAAGNRAILASGKNKKVIHICKDFFRGFFSKISIVHHSVNQPT